MPGRLTVAPCDLRSANEYVVAHHRHHGPVVGYKFALAVLDDQGVVRGVAIVGRPVARMLDDGLTMEVTRVATDGCSGACSCLYGACRRAARRLGIGRLITYTLAEERGVSLLAAGYRRVANVAGRSWDRPGRRRIDRHPTGPKVRWEA